MPGVISGELACCFRVMREAPVMVFELEIFGDGPVDVAVLVGVVNLFVFAGTVPDVGLKRAVRVDLRTVTNVKRARFSAAPMRGAALG